MGAALSVADVAIVTSDNPRSEDPEQIADAVASGVEGPVDVIIDRREAIEAAIEMASEGDVVLILGRGHEPLQEFAAENLPFG